MMTDTGKIAFFGGSFDPPHLGHMAVAEAALRAGVCGHVAWVPAYAPPHKATGGASYADRTAMAEAAISGHADMSVSRIEEELHFTPSYTFEVLDAWERRFGAPPVLLIGADSLRELHTWHRAPELAGRFRIVSYPRGGRPVTAAELERHWPMRTAERLLSDMLRGDFFEISSSELKNRMEKFADTGDIIALKEYLAPEVGEYIVRHGLYVGGGREQSDGRTIRDAEKIH